MTDKKITELSELISPAAGDYLVIVNADTTQKIDWNNLSFLKLSGGEVTGRLQFPGIFGGIHVHDNAVAQTIPTGATYTKLTHFADDDAASDMTPDAANDKITVTVAGNYLLNCSLNFSDDTNNVEWRCAPFIEGVEWDAIHIVRKIGTAGDVGSASMSGIITVSSVPADVDIRGRHDNGGNIDITVEYSNFSLVYVGEI